MALLGYNSKSVFFIVLLRVLGNSSSHSEHTSVGKAFILVLEALKHLKMSINMFVFPVHSIPKSSITAKFIIMFFVFFFSFFPRNFSALLKHYAVVSAGEKFNFNFSSIPDSNVGGYSTYSEPMPH